VSEYRFDDPEGEVGVETILWRTDDGRLLQVPFTYRGAELPGAESHLVGTMDHSVLGPRWVYDGCADPVWAATTVGAIRTGGTQAQMVIEVDGQRVDVPPRLEVRGSGTEGAPVPDVTSVESVSSEDGVTTVVAGPATVRLARVIGTDLAGAETLSGRIDDRDVVLVALDA